jgi:hypothetical protein
MPFPSARQLACHRNSSVRCRKAYYEVLNSLNASNDFDEDDMEGLVFQQEDGVPLPNASMDYEHTFDEPGPGSCDQESGNPPPEPATPMEPLPPSAVGPTEQANEANAVMDNTANENEEEVHQAPSVSTEIVDIYYPGAGSVVGTQTPQFRRLYEEQQRVAPDNIHYPFENEDEWQYGTWMNQSGLPMTEMDKLLNLAYVRWSPTRIYKL